MRHRQIDLSQQLEQQDFVALQEVFKKKGWEVGTAEILMIARSNASSNHWKDIIWQYLNQKQKEQEEAKKHTNTPPTKKVEKSTKRARTKSTSI